ncbi:MAG: DAK2 domain-containing protein, partial [Dehalococcoidia bacterium]|nr:DAK2 domain-containing protein [Dehalococcoidia bacterium]
MSSATVFPRRITGIDGQDLKAAFLGATAFLEQQVPAINALNVFPVPDGDTGTNMALTMRATIGAVADSPEHHVGHVAQKMAQGALMGARGNSGVILSQIVRGFAKSIAEVASLDARRLAEALQGATRTAYQGVTKPVEGTMLTVIRKAAEAAEQVANAGGDCDAVLAAATEAARVAVADTPNLLAVLRDAGVVDSGGQGVWVLLDGMLRTLRGETPPALGEVAQTTTAHAVFSGEQTYGYCTQFLIQGAGLNIDEITRRLDPIGDSMVVVGDENLVRVHIHTFQPGDALNVGSALGILRNISIENMQIQHDVWKEERKAVKPIIEGVSIVAVAAGDGFTKLFESLGVQEVVLGGHTMNPSAQDLVSAIERTPTREVILLPNNDNILLTARQAAALTSRHVGIVPTTTLAQGVAAALAVKFGESF